MLMAGAAGAAEPDRTGGAGGTLAADPDALDAAARVAERQADHAGLMREYVVRHLSGLDSFAGVLGLFRDQYAAALDAATAGLEASAARAGDLTAAYVTTRRELLAADEAARGGMRRLLDAIGEVTGTCAAGPGEPGGVGAGDLLRAGVPADPLGLPGVPEELAGVRDQVLTLADEVEQAADLAVDLVAYERFVEAAR